MTEPEAAAVAAVVEACPSVARLSGGIGVEVATYLPGNRVKGVRFSDGLVEVHVVARFGASLPEVGAEVRKAVAPLVPGRRVDVSIDDLDVPGLDEPTAPVAELPAAELPMPAGR